MGRWRPVFAVAFRCAVFAYAYCFAASAGAWASDLCRQSSDARHQDFVYLLGYCDYPEQWKEACARSSGYKLSGTATLVHGGGYIVTAAHNVVPYTGSPDLGPTLEGERDRRKPGNYRRGDNLPADNPEAISQRPLTISRKVDGVTRVFFVREEARQYGIGPDVSVLRVVNAALAEKLVTLASGRSPYWTEFGHQDRDAYEAAFESLIKSIESDAAMPIVRTAPIITRGERVFAHEAAVTWAFPPDSRKVKSGAQSVTVSRLSQAVEVQHPDPVCEEVRKLVVTDDAGTFQKLSKEDHQGDYEQSLTEGGMSGASQFALIRDEKKIKGYVVRGVFKGVPCRTSDKQCEADYAGVESNLGQYHMLHDARIRFSLLGFPVVKQLPKAAKNSKYISEMTKVLEEEGTDRIHAAFSLIDPNDETSYKYFIGDDSACGDETVGASCMKLSAEFAAALKNWLWTEWRAGVQRRGRDPQDYAYEIYQDLITPVIETMKDSGFGPHARSLTEMYKLWRNDAKRLLAQGSSAQASAEQALQMAARDGISARRSLEMVYAASLSGQADPYSIAYGISEGVRELAAGTVDALNEGYFTNRDARVFAYDKISASVDGYNDGVTLYASSPESFFSDLLGNYAYSVTLLDDWSSRPKVRRRAAQVAAKSLTLDRSTPLALAAAASFSRLEGDEALAAQLLARGFINARERAESVVGAGRPEKVRSFGINVRLIAADPAIVDLTGRERRALSDELNGADLTALIKRMRAMGREEN